MRRTLLWCAVALGSAVIIGAVSWLTAIALDLQRAEHAARVQAVRDENARLALWRMDAQLAPLVAREAARAPAVYGAFFPSERGYNRAPGGLVRGEVILPSPLLAAPPPGVLLYFQIDPAGVFTSPQIPDGAQRALAFDGGYTSEAIVVTAEERLAALHRQMDGADLFAALARTPALIAERSDGRTAVACQQVAAAPIMGNPSSSLSSGTPIVGKQSKVQVAPSSIALAPHAQAEDSQYGKRSGNELYARGQSFRSATGNQQLQQYNSNDNRVVNGVEQQALLSQAVLSSGDLLIEVMRPVWVGDQLLLARRVQIDGAEYVQGCWLDIEQVRMQLRDQVRDLLPAADIVAVTDATQAPAVGLRLAVLPLALVPGNAPGEQLDYPVADSSMPFGALLSAVWITVLIAVVAAVALLAAALRLSDRRGTFVQAVTHELRTPLTTFRLYADLLAGDMVPDPAERRSYLETLRAQADRLAHLVENVLAYARLERGRRAAVNDITAAALIDSVRQRLSDRAAEAGMTLHESHDPQALAMPLRLDTQAVERILFNLIDNAAKYAATATDRRIQIAVQRDGDGIAIRVRDHGPGIAPAARRRLFAPFAKSASDAATSAPGVGLGLALSRRLARDLGGDLRCEDGAEEGACFVVCLPMVAGRAR